MSPRHVLRSMLAAAGILFALVVAVLAVQTIYATSMVHLAQQAIAHSGSTAQDRRWALALIGLFAVWVAETLITWQDAPKLIDTLLGAEERVLAVQSLWAEAEVAHDEQTIDRILDPSFGLTDEDVSTMGKLDVITHARSLSLIWQTLMDEIARVDGATAVGIGIGKMELRSVHPEEPLTYRFTSVFVNQDGEWKALAQQIGPLSF